jgi:hypothetical protein
MKNMVPFIMAFLLIFCACGIYTFSPSALGGIKTIAIPIFKNQTTEYGLEELIAQELNQAFVEDNTLKVLPEHQADAIFMGTVTSYSREAYTYDVNEQVEEYIVRINLEVKLENSKSGKIIWEEKNLSDYGLFSSLEETETDGKNEAVKKIVDEILNRTVKGW